MIARSAIRHRFGAWLALSGLALQIIASVVHSAAHLDHLIGRLTPTQLASEVHWQATAPTGTPIAPDEDSCPLDLSLIVSGTFVVPDPGQVPSLLAIEIASLEAANSAFELALRRHLLPLARAPPVFEILA
jgi:hypothetical protein